MLKTKGTVIKEQDYALLRNVEMILAMPPVTKKQEVARTVLEKAWCEKGQVVVAIGAIKAYFSK